MSNERGRKRGWIWFVSKGNYKYGGNDVPESELTRRWYEELPYDPSWQMEGVLGAEELIRQAREYGYKNAKWFFYRKDNQIIDEILQLQEVGEIWHWKYQWLSDRKCYEFLFYVTDFDNKEEIDVMATLLMEKFNPWDMYFKPDVYTRAGVYSGNEWLIKPWIYRYKKGEFIYGGGLGKDYAP